MLFWCLLIWGNDFFLLYFWCNWFTERQEAHYNIMTWFLLFFFFWRCNKIPASNLNHTSLDTLIKVMHILKQQIRYSAVCTMGVCMNLRTKGWNKVWLFSTWHLMTHLYIFFFSSCIFRHGSSRGLNREMLPLKDITVVLLNWILRSFLWKYRFFTSLKKLGQMHVAMLSGVIYSYY